MCCERGGWVRQGKKRKSKPFSEQKGKEEPCTGSLLSEEHSRVNYIVVVPFLYFYTLQQLCLPVGLPLFCKFFFFHIRIFKMPQCVFVPCKKIHIYVVHLWNLVFLTSLYNLTNPHIDTPERASNNSLLPIHLFTSHKVQVLCAQCRVQLSCIPCDLTHTSTRSVQMHT